MKDGTQLPLSPPQLEIIGDLDTQNLNRDHCLVRVSSDVLIYLRPAGIAAGITLPRGTDILLVVPEAHGRWIDDRYFERAEEEARQRRELQHQALTGGAVSLAEAEVDVSYHDNGEASDIPF